MSKIVNNMKTGLSLETDHLVNTWAGLDNVEAFKVQNMINEDTRIKDIVHHISVVKKEYHKSKYHEFRVVRDKSIRVAVAKHMENFCSDKGKMIKNILDWPFRKVVLDYLIVDDKLILEPQAVKSLVDTIIEDWTRKHLVSGVLPAWWLDQYAPLNYIANDAFSGVMSDISLDKLLVVVKELPDGKAVGLSGISNKLWKHSVLKGTSTQSPIFAVGSIVEDALEKDREFLIRIKMCLHFINFFGGIHNGRCNQVMMDFGLSNSYIVYDSLDQREIFYNLLLCEVKKHEQLYDYRMCSNFHTRSDRPDLNNSKTSFFAAAAMQTILNIASKFFSINDISINTDKTVAILINQGVQKAVLSISESRILVAKRSESYYYLGIFLFTESLSKLSLAKVHANVRFFSNVVLRKAITEKQFLYLVSAVLQPIVYKLLKRGLKLKANLSKDFPSMALHYPKLYGLKPFEQAASWMFRHPLCFPITLPINSLNCFLAGAMHALTLCNTSLCGILSNVFKTGFGVPILDILGVSGYLSVRKSFRKYGLIFANQLLDCHDGKGLILGVLFLPGLFLQRFGSIDACGGAAAYFSKADVSIGVRVFGLLSSILVELQAITLALECVPDSNTVTLFMNSQASLDICKFKILPYEVSALSPVNYREEKIMAGVSAVGGKIIQSLCKVGSSDDFYMLLAKGFVLKSWVSDAALCLGLASGGSLIVKLVCNLTESHRSDIWMPAAKLRAFYEKHNLLLCNGLTMPSIVDLPGLWNAGVIRDFGFRLSIHMCFSLCPCLARLDFGFLNSILLMVPACV
ncbi:hypothetical protein G9A89_015557 [Geosiphon pyriformis]|nr:hypothetical protein G9A89_015557 [Geosiphon pyriformis]